MSPVEPNANSLEGEAKWPFFNCHVSDIISCYLYLSMARCPFTHSRKSLSEVPGLKEQNVLWRRLPASILVPLGLDGEGHGPQQELGATAGSWWGKPRPCHNLQNHSVCQPPGSPGQPGHCHELPTQWLCSGKWSYVREQTISLNHLTLAHCSHVPGTMSNAEAPRVNKI